MLVGVFFSRTKSTTDSPLESRTPATRNNRGPLPDPVDIGGLSVLHLRTLVKTRRRSSKRYSDPLLHPVTLRNGDCHSRGDFLSLLWHNDEFKTFPTLYIDSHPSCRGGTLLRSTLTRSPHDRLTWSSKVWVVTGLDGVGVPTRVRRGVSEETLFRYRF